MHDKYRVVSHFKILTLTSPNVNVSVVFAETLNTDFLPLQLGRLSPVKKAETLNLFLSDFVKNERNNKYKKKKQKKIKDMREAIIEEGLKSNMKDRFKKAEKESKKPEE